jgi:hypothetical protein
MSISTKELKQTDVETIEQTEGCPRCGNQYIVIWLKKGCDFNDFGDRYCPLCGFVTETFYMKAPG